MLYVILNMCVLVASGVKKQGDLPSFSQERGYVSKSEYSTSGKASSYHVCFEISEESWGQVTIIYIIWFDTTRGNVMPVMPFIGLCKCLLAAVKTFKHIVNI